jgi:hypothetical protein
MRKYAQYAAAAAGAVFVLAIVLWANSGAVTTGAATVRSGAAISPHEMMTSSRNLPVQVFRDPF